MTPEQLKASILQYAIQGKLVEQRVEEGTGEELYQQIQAEKQRLIQEKKIKKEKPLAEISRKLEVGQGWKCWFMEFRSHTFEDKPRILWRYHSMVENWRLK